MTDSERATDVTREDTPVGEIAAVAAQVARLLGAAVEGRAYRGDGFAFGVSGTDSADLNLAIVWGSGTDAPSALSAWSGPMVALGLGSGEEVIAGLAPTVDLVDVGARLPVWACPTPGPVPTGGMTVVEVHLPEQLAEAQQIVATSFGLDEATVGAAFPASSLATAGLRWYLGSVDDEPVTCVATLADGAVGSLWCGGTLPSARGHGHFTVLLAAAMRGAGDGAVQRWWGITEAEASARALQRLGAHQVGDARVWVRGSAVGELIANPAG